MKLINVGYGSMISADRVVAIVAPGSAPIKRIIHDAREKGMLIDATYGRKTKAVIICDSEHIVLSGIPLETVTEQLEKNQDEQGQDNE